MTKKEYKELLADKYKAWDYEAVQTDIQNSFHPT